MADRPEKPWWVGDDEDDEEPSDRSVEPRPEADGDPAATASGVAPVLEAADEDDASAEPGPEERPTVNPPFDPAELARHAIPTPTSMKAVVPPSPHTIPTPPTGIEPPPAATPTAPPPGSQRRKTPGTMLSLANARVQSSLPPSRGRQGSRLPASSRSRAEPAPGRPPASRRPVDAPRLSEVEHEWAELEMATRPPPPDGPEVDPILEIAAYPGPSLDLDEIDESVPTVRHPAIMEALPSGPEQEMNDRLSLGDYSGALEVAERILGVDRDNAAARACAENCRAVLRQMYATRIGPLDRVPVVTVPRDQLRWLSIDHRAGFVLSLIDGVSTLEMILDVSGMPQLDALRILSELVQQRIISLR